MEKPDLGLRLRRAPAQLSGHRLGGRSRSRETIPFFALTVATHAEPNALDGLDAKLIPHPTDSHPPLSIRLAALGKNLIEIRSDALSLSPSPSSNEVIDNCEELEVQLTMVEQALLCPEQTSDIPPPLPSDAATL